MIPSLPKPIAAGSPDRSRDRALRHDRHRRGWRGQLLRRWASFAATWWRLRRPRALSYRASLIVSLSLLVVATGLAVSLFAFRGARANTTSLAHSLFQEVSDHAVTKTRGFLLRAEPHRAGRWETSPTSGSRPPTRDRLARQLTAVLRANPGRELDQLQRTRPARSSGPTARPRTRSASTGAASKRPGRRSRVEHDVLADGSWKLFRTRRRLRLRPAQAPVLRAAPRPRGGIVWLPPYIFYDQGVPGVTCANPIYDPARQAPAASSPSTSTSTPSRSSSASSRSAPTRRLFIMSSDGVLLAHPTHRARRSAPGGRGQRRAAHDRRPERPAHPGVRRPAHAPSDRTPAAAAADHAAAVRVPPGRHRLLRPRHRVHDRRRPGVDRRRDGAAVRLPRRRRAARTAPLAGGVAGGGARRGDVATLLARRVSGPILSLVSFMGKRRRRATCRRATTWPRLGGAREFRQLSAALDQMIDDLRDRTRLRGAMAVAMEVQQALLPEGPPRVDGLDVYGFSTYCDETGGDYYDYVVLDGSPAPAACSSPSATSWATASARPW